MIEEFKIKNYKNLKFEREIELKKINILIGANGSGKSNFIDATLFFKDLIKKGLQNAIRDRKSNEILNKYEEDNKVELEVSLNTETKFSSFKYKLVFSIPKDRDYYHSLPIIQKEELTYKEPSDPNKDKPFGFIRCHVYRPGKCDFPILIKDRKGNKRLISEVIKISQEETFFKQVEYISMKFAREKKYIPKFYNVIRDINDYVESWRHFTMSEIDLAELRKPFEITGKTDKLLPNLKNLGEFLINNIYTKYTDEGVGFFDRLNSYFNQPVEIKFQQVDRYLHIYLRLNDRDFPMSSLSDGQIRIIILLAILYLDKNSKVIFIDEPELNLHTSWLLKLRRDFYNSDKQLIISTHSADLLDTFTEDFIDGEVNILVFENGKVEQLKFNEKFKDRFEEGYELGDLYRMGDPIIGGWKD